MTPDWVIRQTREARFYVSLVRELPFGPEFGAAMGRWCRAGTAPTEDFWQVYVATQDETTVAVGGLYRETSMPPSQVWLGWFGVRPAYRRQGIARRFLDYLIAQSRTARFAELCVYTGAGNHGAIACYRDAGFLARGSAGASACPWVADPSHEILVRAL